MSKSNNKSQVCANCLICKWFPECLVNDSFVYCIYSLVKKSCFYCDAPNGDCIYQCPDFKVVKKS